MKRVNLFTGMDDGPIGGAQLDLIVEPGVSEAERLDRERAAAQITCSETLSMGDAPMNEQLQRVRAVIFHPQVVRAASGAPEWRDHAAMRRLVSLKREHRNRKRCLANMREDVAATGRTMAILPPVRTGRQQCADALALGGLPADLAALASAVVAG